MDAGKSVLGPATESLLNLPGLWLEVSTGMALARYNKLLSSLSEQQIVAAATTFLMPQPLQTNWIVQVTSSK